MPYGGLVGAIPVGSVTQESGSRRDSDTSSCSGGWRGGRSDISRGGSSGSRTRTTVHNDDITSITRRKWQVYGAGSARGNQQQTSRYVNGSSNRSCHISGTETVDLVQGNLTNAGRACARQVVDWEQVVTGRGVGGKSRQVV